MSAPIFGGGVAGGAVRDAGTVLVARDGQAGVEILMVKREQRAAFMAGAYVFPGGRADASEPHGTAGAAAREAFEEAGVLLAKRGDEWVRTDDETWARELRRALLARDPAARFHDGIAARGVRLAVEEMVLFARWVTPATEQRRFDARFYLVRMPPGQTAGHDALEVSEHRWATATALLEAERTGEIKLPPPTQHHLRDLSPCATVDEALAWARGRSHEPVRPKLVPDGDTVAVVLPWDPAYAALPGEGAPLPMDHPLAGPILRYRLLDGHWVPQR